LLKKPKAKEGYRVCLVCGEEKPLTTECFPKRGGTHQFRHICRLCVRVRNKVKLENNVMRRINKNVSNRIRLIIRDKKSRVSEYYLGCSSGFYRRYLESLFREGMSWGNYGKDGWEIDHIRPVSSYNLTNQEELLAAFNYTNTQPLWAKENMVKNSSYNGKKYYYELV